MRLGLQMGIEVFWGIKKEKFMSESTESNRKSDRWVDAVAAVVLVAIFVTTFVYWVSSQS